MSCCNTCNVNPCNCTYQVVLPDNPVVGYSAANINLTGIGVYNSTNGTEFDFRGITSANNALIVTLDAPNNTVLLTMDIQQIIDDLPDATTTQRGVLETATDAEAQGKALDNKILTPLNLAALGSTSSFAGLIEIATDAEALAGASTSLAITPANMAYVNAAQLTTQTFADAVARAAAVPDFEGQFGYQVDTVQACVAYGTNSGEWNDVFTAGGVSGVFDNTTINVTAGQQLSIGDSGTFALGTSLLFFLSGVQRFGAISTLDFLPGSIVQLNSVSVPAASVITTGGSAGELSSVLKNTFISTSNIQTGYTTFSNPATVRTLDTGATTLQEVAQCLGTLISDLKSALLPAT